MAQAAWTGRTPWRRVLTGALLAALALGGIGAASPGPTAEAATPVRIMPVGDSITSSPGCWRALLWDRLQRSGHTDVDMVGTQPSQGCSIPFDGDGEGRGSALATTTADRRDLVASFAANRPDVVLMHLGTNDVWNGRPVATVLAAFGTLVDQMRAANPSVKVLVAQILPMDTANCVACGQRVIDLNAAVPAWAAGKGTSTSPVVVVDQWTGFVPSTDTRDGVHPNAAGDRKMADRWFLALSALLNTTAPTLPPTPDTTPSPTPTPTVTPPPTVTPTPTVTPDPNASPTPTVTPTPTVAPTWTVIGTPTVAVSDTPGPSGAPSCTAALWVSYQWPNGYQGQVTVTTGAGGARSWTVSWTPPPGHAVTQVWGATATIAPSGITATSPGWGAPVPPGRSAALGFLGSFPGSGPVTPPAPAVTCTAR